MAALNGDRSPVATEADGVQEGPMLNSDGGLTATPLSGDSSAKVLTPCSSIPRRFIFVFMGFFCFFNVSALRNNLNVAIVSMVNITHMKQLMDEDQSHLHNATDSVVCDAGNKTSSVIDGPFNWNSKQQGYLLGAFYLGYMLTQIPGGMLAERYGGKCVLLVGLTWAALWIILTPTVAKAGGFAGLLTIRILGGIGQGVEYPAMHVMLSNWAPPLERGRMVTFVYAGSKVGAVVVMSVSGTLCHRVGWQYVFYVFGGTGFVWSVLWIFLVYDKPSVHPRITPRERHYIETAQGLQRTKGVKVKTPWLKIASSPAVYALVMGNFAHNWLNIFLSTETPQFLTYMLKFNIQDSGIVTGAAYLLMWFGMLLGGVGADLLLTRRHLPVTWTRKIFVFLGFVFPAVFLVSLGYVECKKVLAIILLAITGFCLGLSWAGWGVNHLDIAPLFAGTLFGITNCISTIPGIVAPAIVGALTYRNQTHAAWRCAFYITGSVLLFGTLVFLIIGTGKLQRWSYPQSMPPLEVADGRVLPKASKADEQNDNEATNRVSPTK